MFSEKIRNKNPIKMRRRRLRNEATHQEIILWSRLRRSQLGYKFRRQHSFGRYIVDFFCSEKQLVIEIDGWQHGEPEGKHYDCERTRYLEEFGMKVVRFWNGDINGNLEGVILEIERHLHERETTPVPSLQRRGGIAGF